MPDNDTVSLARLVADVLLRLLLRDPHLSAISEAERAELGRGIAAWDRREIAAMIANRGFEPGPIGFLDAEKAAPGVFERIAVDRAHGKALLDEAIIGVEERAQRLAKTIEENTATVYRLTGKPPWRPWLVEILRYEIDAAIRCERERPDDPWPALTSGATLGVVNVRGMLRMNDYGKPDKALRPGLWRVERIGE